MLEFGSHTKQLELTVPTKSYVVCATPRSGSSLLCRGLKQIGIAGIPHEYFNDIHINELATRFNVTTIRDYIPRLLKEKQSSNGVFGFKLMFHKFEQYLSGTDLSHVFPNLAYIYITRSDRIRQAVSRARAGQTGEWSSQHVAVQEPVYRFEEILNYYNWIARHEQQWESYFACQQVQPLRIVYEDFAENYEATLIRVIQYLGLEPPGIGSIAAPALKRQSDRLSEMWIETFNSDLKKKGINLAD